MLLRYSGGFYHLCSLLLLCVIHDASGAIFPEIATAQGCTNHPTPVMGCIKNDPPFVIVTYPAGNFRCGSALTLEQASKEPKLSVLVEQPSDFYTILLVDTTDSFLHPILHYGATNLRGSDLLQLDVSNSTLAFAKYRGPSPPSYIPGIESQHFIYEWIVSKQDAYVPEPPLVESFTQFDYNQYLNDVNATLVTSTYFSSGFCVREMGDDSFPVEGGGSIQYDVKSLATSSARSKLSCALSVMIVACFGILQF